MALMDKSAMLQRESLCRSCRSAHIQRGYEEGERGELRSERRNRASRARGRSSEPCVGSRCGALEETRFCAYAFPALRAVPFAVRFCTDYRDRDAPTSEQLEKAFHC